jgi:hypothetical protein
MRNGSSCAGERGSPDPRTSRHPLTPARGRPGLERQPPEAARISRRCAMARLPAGIPVGWPVPDEEGRLIRPDQTGGCGGVARLQHCHPLHGKRFGFRTTIHWHLQVWNQLRNMFTCTAAGRQRPRLKRVGHQTQCPFCRDENAWPLAHEIGHNWTFCRRRTIQLWPVRSDRVARGVRAADLGLRLARRAGTCRFMCVLREYVHYAGSWAGVVCQCGGRVAACSSGSGQPMPSSCQARVASSHCWKSWVVQPRRTRRR